MELDAIIFVWITWTDGQHWKWHCRDILVAFTCASPPFEKLVCELAHLLVQDFGKVIDIYIYLFSYNLP